MPRLAIMTSPTHSADTVIAATRHWLERAVIGLNLCPFAKSVYVKGQVRYVVSTVTEAPDAMDELERELRLLADADPDQIDTTLLILPDAVADFLDFNDLLYFAERLLGSLGLEGTLQIASFHPQYQFAGTEPDDIENYTNRAPYPILHLLREDSIARAAAAFPDAADIYERNQATMRRLGHEGWQRWMAGEDEPEKG
ncbi:peptidase [Cupriavidus necator]|uniref:Peptidase n=2 Tax=Cupriavidus necator TaxID=106590 RepID=A0A1U9UL45_CUPNE|nr:peptidase [Cupriavidus necator]